MGASQTRQVGEVQNLSPEQQQAFSSLFQGLDPRGLGEILGNPEEQNRFFDEAIQAPQLKQFQEDFLPQIQEQFAGATSGSGFNRAIGRALSDFESSLASQRAGFQRQSLQDQQALLQNLLGINATTPILEEGQPGLGATLGGGLGNVLGTFAGGVAGKAGGALGSQLGTRIGDLFKSRNGNQGSGLPKQINDILVKYR